jgi:membrane protein
MRSDALETQTVTFGVDLWRRAREHDATGLAAELAYRFLFAIFPFGLFLIASAAFAATALGLGDPTGTIITAFGDNLPPALATAVRPELQHVLEHERFALVSSGAILALFAALTGTMTVIKAMNRAYGVRDNRSFVRRYALGIGLTVGASLGILIAFVTIVGGAFLSERFASGLGLGSAAWGVISLLRWPVVFGLLVLAALVVYRVGPNLQPTWTEAVRGAIVFAIGWLVATAGFAWYALSVANYDVTYGVIGGVIVLMTWLYLTGLMLLMGAEVVAVQVWRTDPDRISRRQAETAAQKVVDATHDTAVQALTTFQRTREAGRSKVGRDA